MTYSNTKGSLQEATLEIQRLQQELQETKAELAEKEKVFKVALDSKYVDYSDRHIPSKEDYLSPQVNSMSAYQQTFDRLNFILKNTNLEFWEWDMKDRLIYWSNTFQERLGYTPKEFPSTVEAFLEYMPPVDVKNMAQVFKVHLEDKTPFRLDHRIRTKTGEYRWFENIGQVKFDAAGKPVSMSGLLSDIHERKTLELAMQEKDFLLSEVSRIGKAGGWEFDLASGKVTWTEELYKMRGLPVDTEMTAEAVVESYVGKSAVQLEKAVREAIEEGKTYDLKLLLKRTYGNPIYTRAIGEPVYDSKGNCIKLRGVCQDIDEAYQKERELEKSLKLLNQHNTRLSNFAYIVSHNLRKHTGNLEMMIDFYNTAAKKEQNIYFEKIEQISESLRQTIDSLAEVIKIQDNSNAKRGDISFEAILKRVEVTLERDLSESKATIVADFEDCTTMYYPLAYLESILLNLISNSIRYRSPERNPLIKLKTQMIDDGYMLRYTDNGVGIDLERYGDKIFGMYKTFHGNADARGIGLFLVKNQIESLGGSIEVESEVGKGTTFTIIF